VRRNNHQTAVPKVKEDLVMPRTLVISGLAAAGLLVAACGSSASGASSPGGGHAGAANGVVSVRHLRSIGTALVNGSGLTIYTPKTPAEVKGRIKCTGPCLGFWIPVTASSARPVVRGLPGVLGKVHRPGGGTQVTYNGRPLYTFRLDTAPGQARGNGFHDSFNGTNFTWQVVTATGKAAAGGSPSPAPSYSYQTGY
jgi:predicted lipoprotein with Yx(FWY)xxD motif